MKPWQVRHRGCALTVMLGFAERRPLESRVDGMKIYVGNLSYRMTADELKTLFSQFGQVDKVDIIIDRDTGQSKGFGFIEMPVNGDAEKAIAGLHGTEVGGRTITVNQAKPKTDPPRGRPQHRHR